LFCWLRFANFAHNVFCIEDKQPEEKKEVKPVDKKDPKVTPDRKDVKPAVDKKDPRAVEKKDVKPVENKVEAPKKGKL